MSIVIIGGHDRMVRQYRTICKEHNCKAKIFTQMPSCLNKKNWKSRSCCIIYKYGITQNGTLCSQ